MSGILSVLFARFSIRASGLVRVSLLDILGHKQGLLRICFYGDKQANQDNNFVHCIIYFDESKEAVMS